MARRKSKYLIFSPKQQKAFLKFLATPLGEATRLVLIIIVVITLSWGIVNADELNPFTPSIEDAKTSFSVIGTVSVIDNTHLIVTNAKGSDDTGESEYNLNIKNLDKVETSKYQTLQLTDLKVGDTVIAQGVTTDSVFFITRIILFSSTPLPVFEEEQTATTTPEEVTSSENTVDVSTTTPEQTATTTPDEVTSSEDNVDVSTTTPEQTATTTETNVATTTQDVVEQVGDLIEEVVAPIVDTIDTIIENITESEPQPEEPQTEIE